MFGGVLSLHPSCERSGRYNKEETLAHRLKAQVQSYTAAVGDL